MKKGDLLDLQISRYAFEGKGIAKINKEKYDSGDLFQTDNLQSNNFVIFVNGTYPGDMVTAQILKIKNSYAEAKVIKVLNQNEKRENARCKYFGVCGGCKQQNLNYEWQLKYKQEQVQDIFNRLGGFSNFEILDIDPSEKIFFYRNKMEYSFSDQRWLTDEEIKSEIQFDKSFSLGLHIPGIYDKILDINECFLQSEISNRILNFTRTFFKSRECSIYSTKTHSGYLRNLVIKTSHHTKEVMVNLVTSEENKTLIKEYCDELLIRIPQVTTIINNINLKKAQIAFGDYEILFYGPGYIFDYIGDYKFRVSANSFFQTNTLQAEKLYKTALEFADPKGTEIIYDMYCGAGTISSYFSKYAHEIYAFETIDSALQDAEENVKLNGVKNITFIKSDLNKSFLNSLEIKSIPKPEIVILDPPRSGMNPITVQDIVSLSPQKIIYISCNPATQVRDLKLFSQSGYSLQKIKPVDMFPHTYHIENVAFMTLC